MDDKDKEIISEGKEEFKGLKKGIKFNNVNFSYTDDVHILKNVSFSIEKGKMIALVGPTGAGKTTIINLILRLYDCAPKSIKIDDKDIRDFTFKSLRSKMALVSQEPIIFNNSIKYNIAYGFDNVPKEKVIEAAKKAQLYKFIMKLPDKFDTIVGDRGVKLSGGEKQRLSIARAMLKNAEILIFDEATSSLDTQTEISIQNAINEAVKERTAIVIAHRLSTIRNADKIIVIDKGRIVEQGALNELLEKKGRFYEMWEAQKFD
jgi:ABC-type multidrug transport system fused ATPase/permease subunit